MKCPTPPHHSAEIPQHSEKAVQCTGRNREKSSVGMMRGAGSSPNTGRGITEKNTNASTVFPRRQSSKPEQIKALYVGKPYSAQILLWFYDLLFRGCQSLVLVGWQKQRTRDEVEREEQGWKIRRKVTPRNWVCMWDCRNPQAKQHRRHKTQPLMLRPH